MYGRITEGGRIAADGGGGAHCALVDVEEAVDVEVAAEADGCIHKPKFPL